MTIFCVGSINADHFYEVPHIPAPGETLAARHHRIGLGGKGANQSVAAVQSGSRVVHVGAVGADGAWAIDRLAALGVETDHIATVAEPTAHAIITVADDGENAIVIYSGANMALSEDGMGAALAGAQPGDLLILQNEAALQVEAARLGKAAGLKVVYSAAPFDEAAVRAVLPHVDILAVNDVEAQQLETAFGVAVKDLPVSGVLVTKGAEGAEFVTGDETIAVAAHAVAPRDTTGAGDTFLGYFAGGLDQGFDTRAAMALASAAAALKVTRPGTADAIPSRRDVDAFRA